MKITLLLFLLLAISRLSAQQITIKLPEHATLLLVRKPFVAAGKSLKYSAEQSGVGRSLLAIDGWPVFGADGEMPKYVLREAVLTLHGHVYTLRTDHMYNPWFGSGIEAAPNSEYALLFKKSSGYVLQAVFSDGAGTYFAEWKITGSKTIRTCLSADEDVIVGFYKRRK